MNPKLLEIAQKNPSRGDATIALIIALNLFLVFLIGSIFNFERSEKGLCFIAGILSVCTCVPGALFWLAANRWDRNGADDQA